MEKVDLSWVIMVTLALQRKWRKGPLLNEHHIPQQLERSRRRSQVSSCSLSETTMTLYCILSFSLFSVFYFFSAFPVHYRYILGFLDILADPVGSPSLYYLPLEMFCSWCLLFHLQQDACHRDYLRDSTITWAWPFYSDKNLCHAVGWPLLFVVLSSLYVAVMTEE